MAISVSTVENEISLTNTPLDFSFKKISTIDDVVKRQPRTNRVGRVPDVGPNNKFVTTAVWLSNNRLQTTLEAAAILDHVLERPDQLAWLDLSFNHIYDIDEEILHFENLKILYLHGNQIHNISVVSILKSLTGLRTLTLHGNPVNDISHYRSLIVNLLPQLSSLDFCPILDSERKALPPPAYYDLIKADKKKPPK